MKNQSLMVVENNIFSKIKKFFYNIKEKLFSKNKFNNQTSNEQLETNVEEQSSKDNNFREDIRIELKQSNNPQNKKDFLSEINGNVEKLELLSTDRLRRLEKFYDGVIAKNKMVISKLNND